MQKPAPAVNGKPTFGAQLWISSEFCTIGGIYSHPMRFCFCVVFLVQSLAFAHSPATRAFPYKDPQNVRITSSAVGSVGLLHLSSADLGREGVIRFSVTGEYFRSPDFPVRGALNTRAAGKFAVSFVPLPFLEAYLAYAPLANTNSTSTPALIQALGDLAFGLKGSRQFAPGFHAGLELRLQTFSAVSGQELQRNPVGISPKVLGTYDLAQVFPNVPVRLHGNLGATFDGTRNSEQVQRLRTADEFALAVNQYHRVTFGVGAELPLPWATPFLEYNLGIPLGVPGGTLVGPDGVRVTVAAAMPQTFTLGAKVTALRAVSFLLGMDMGLTKRVGRGVPAVAPYNLFLGASFNVDPFQPSETRIVERVLEKQIPQRPTTGRVSGMAVDATTRKPLSGVIVSMEGQGLPPVATDAESGRFLTHELPAGWVRLSARKEGYRPTSVDVTLEAGKTSSVELSLESEIKRAAFLLSVTSKKKPVKATAIFRGDTDQEVLSNAQSTRVELPAGRYVVDVKADGYLAQTREVQASNGAEMALAFDLQAEPKKKLVVVKENKIDILRQVHFANGKATLLPDSYALLAQVLDAIVKSDIKRIRIEGHTDNKGNKAKNLKLSEERAAAVADFLEKQGIDRSRMETAGFGDTRPIAPNLTPRGRELNRRVEFLILGR